MHYELGIVRRQDWFAMYFVKAAEVPVPVVCPNCKMSILPTAVPAAGKCLHGNTAAIRLSRYRWIQTGMPATLPGHNSPNEDWSEFIYE